MIDSHAVPLALMLERALVNAVITHTYTKQQIDVATYRQMLQLQWRRHWPALDLNHARHFTPTIASGELQDLLLATVKQALKHYVRDNRVQTAAIVLVGGDGSGFKLEDLVGRLLEVAIGRGPLRAANAFYQGVHGSPVSFRRIALLNGVKFDIEAPVRNGIRMITLPSSTSRLPPYFPDWSRMNTEDLLGQTILVVDYTVSQMFANPELMISYDELFRCEQVCSDFPDFDVRQFCDALSLVSDRPIAHVAEWTHVDPDAVFIPRWAHMGGVTHYPFAPRPQGSVTATKSNVRDAVALYETRKSLSTGPDQKFEVPIQRWIRSKSDQSITDKFIDLRIALESLYLKDFVGEYSQEMRFRLSMFGAWHLGTDFHERRRIRKRIRDAYDRASGAVHKGAVEYSPENLELLSDGQDFCRQGILKLLSEGEPDDWGDLILGAGYDEVLT